MSRPFCLLYGAKDQSAQRVAYLCGGDGRPNTFGKFLPVVSSKKYEIGIIEQRGVPSGARSICYWSYGGDRGTGAGRSARDDGKFVHCSIAGATFGFGVRG